MKSRGSMTRSNIIPLGMGILVLLTSCSRTTDIIPTSTPTDISGGIAPTPTGESTCIGLSGDLEMQVLIGPSESVGLEPIAVGNIPFSVASAGGADLVQGNGAISYQDVLKKKWGTYSVYFDLDAQVNGECEGNEQPGILDITTVISGEQLVEVRAEGFQQDFPWSGSQVIDLSFPIEEGATAQGEGWTFVLHLK